MSTKHGPAGDDRLLASLRELLPELAAGAVVELEVSVGDQHLYLRQRPGLVPVPGEPATLPVEGVDADSGLVSITTPLSGVFYAAPAPGEAPYVNEGDVVEAGQTVALVEAMKVFNEIHVEEPGTVVKVQATPGQLVQSGQTLMLIRPAAAPDEAGAAP